MDTPADLVDRNFVRHEPDQLRVTDVERHKAFSNRAVVRRTPLRARRSGHVEAEASPNPADQHRQMVRVRQTRQKAYVKMPASGSSSSDPVAGCWWIGAGAAKRSATARSPPTSDVTFSTAEYWRTPPHFRPIPYSPPFREEPPKTSSNISNTISNLSKSSFIPFPQIHSQRFVFSFLFTV